MEDCAVCEKIEKMNDIFVRPTNGLLADGGLTEIVLSISLHRMLHKKNNRSIKGEASAVCSSTGGGSTCTRVSHAPWRKIIVRQVALTHHRMSQMIQTWS
jgi:hypothetical protein